MREALDAKDGHRGEDTTLGPRSEDWSGQDNIPALQDLHCNCIAAHMCGSF